MISTFKPNTPIFLSKGFYSHDGVLAQLDEFADAGCSETELSDRLMALSHAVDAAYTRYQAIFDQAYKEIFSYDISEPMGVFIAEHAVKHNELPTEDEVTNEAFRRIVERCDVDKLRQAMLSTDMMFCKLSPAFARAYF